MSDDSTENQGNRSWFEKITSMMAGEPESIDELMEILQAASARRIIDGDVLDILEGAVQAGGMDVQDVMIPRAQMVTMTVNDEPETLLRLVAESGHSRFPVLGTKPDQVVGILMAKDLLKLSWRNQLNHQSVAAALRTPSFIPETKPLMQQLKDFRQNRNHMAIVVDEYGSIAGLATIEDVLEQIVGDISDEYDTSEEGYIIRRTDNRFTVKGQTPVSEFNDYFEARLDEEEFDTVGGLLLKHFGRMPKRDESVSFDQFSFTVLKTDGRKIQSIDVSRND